VTAQDEKFMRLALRLAEKGIGLVEPNPAVGCVITQSGQEIGRGSHGTRAIGRASRWRLHAVFVEADGLADQSQKGGAGWKVPDRADAPELRSDRPLVLPCRHQSLLPEAERAVRLERRHAAEDPVMHEVGEGPLHGLSTSDTRRTTARIRRESAARRADFVM
jgi:hypothetical protein